jgi:hypothetical protein
VNKPNPRGLFRYERRHEPLASPAVLTRRLAGMSVVAVGLIAASLAVGIAGYHWIVGIPRLVDCVYSAAMILGGMGPVLEDPPTDAGKWFASAYAIYCGVVLLVSVGLLISPLFHRLLHHFHVDSGD